jgi:glycosyltransferase involved in cell wall biosynthesis
LYSWRVRPYQQIYLAEVLREHRDRLEQTARELAERGEPITELEARLIADAGTARLLEVENALRHAAHTSRRALVLRPRLDGRPALPLRVGARVWSWTKPRIGVLRHYEPKPILLPASYFRTAPPAPAPTISVITPSFGQGRFIDRTMYSVISQNYPALEYHVQDGGSTDETLAVLARFEDILTSWSSEPDSGQADAINRGFRHTTGEIMAWLNSDDLLLPGSLAYVARYFAEHPDVDVVYGHRLLIDESDGQVGAWVLPKHDDLALTLADYVPQETLFWRRRIWEASGEHVDADFGYALDWDLLLRFREAGATMVRLPRFLGAFRIHDAQKTTAADALGVVETTRLRQRVHKRDVPIDEVLQRLKPYFVRHILVHSWQRFVDRLPLRRIRVTTVPAEPTLRSTLATSSGATPSSESDAPRRALVQSGNVVTSATHPRPTSAASAVRESRPSGS